MSNAWDHAESLSEKHANQGGVFVRLANHGDKVVGAFCGEPHAREVHWTGERYVECSGQGCALCSGGKKPSLRVMLNFYVPAEGVMKVYETGTRVFRDLLKLRAKYGLGSWLFEIERHGEAGSTKTRYSVLPEAQIDAAMRARIDAAELIDLSSLGSGDDEDEGSASVPVGVGTGAGPAARHAPGSSAGYAAGPGAGSAASSGTGSAAGHAAGPATIPTDRVAPLVARLKALPRSGVDTFLGRFGIGRVRDLAAVDEQAAYALLAELEARHAPPPAPATEIDPFA
jgi:hypothetical protein